MEIGSLDRYHELLNIAKGKGDRRGEGSAYTNLGNTYQSLGKYHEAIEYHQRCLCIATEIGDRQGEGRAYEDLGNAYQSLGKYHEAIEYHEKCLCIVIEIGDRQGEGRAYGNLGNAYRSLGKYQDAIEYHKKHLSIATEIGDRQGEGRAYENLGNAYRSLDKYHEAIKYHEKCLSIATEIGDRQGEGRAYGNLGNAYQSLGKYHEAIEYYKKHLSIATEIGDKRGEGLAYGGLGNANQLLGRYQDDIEYLQKCLNIATEKGDKQVEGFAYESLGIAYRSLGKYQEAIEYHKKHLSIATVIGDKRGEGRAYGNLGNAYRSLGEYKDAIEYHEKCLCIATEIGDKRGEGLAYGDLGNAYQSLGKYHEAIEYHKKCLNIATEIGHREVEGLAYESLGNAYQSLGKYQEAFKYHEKWLSIATEIGAKQGEIVTYGDIGNAYRSLSKHQEAIEYHEKHLSIATEIDDKQGEGLPNHNIDQEPETVPPEILARGPLAQAAYKQALKSGKVKNLRLAVVLVGQSRSGKTSLLRSLNGKIFNPSEDSTVGAKLQCSLSKVDGDWEKIENNENLLCNHCTAMEVVKHLLKKPAQPNSNTEDDIDSLETNQKEYSTKDDSAQNNATARLVEQKTLQLQEDNNTTQNENLDHFDKQDLLPDEVAMLTETILQNPDAEKKMEDCLFFNTIDFAGQPVYSVTHPVFLPPKGIYLLVHSLENDLHAQATPMVKTGAVQRERSDHNPMTNMGHLKFWLSLIDANSTQEGGSPVFVVSTHADKPFEADVEHTGREILATLREEEFAPRRHVVHDKIYTVDNTVSGSSSPEDAGVKELKAQICQKAKSLPQMNEDIPVRWLLFEKKLEHLVRDEKKKHIPFQEAESIALQCEVDISSDELETLLNYLHDLKVIIHFPETGMIIIDTQWLLDMFAKVITVQPIEYHGEYENEWQKLEDQGIIDFKFLKHLWKDLLNDDTSVESLITIMERFSLVCKQRDESFLVPAMLSNSTIDESHELMKSNDCASPLVVRFKSSHFPLGLLPRLLVAVDEMCNVKWKSSTPPHLSQNFARFYIQLDGDYELNLVFIADTATIAVALVDDVNPGRRDDLYVQQCKSILEFLRKTLDEMVKSFPWMKSLEKFDFCIRCPICLNFCKKHNIHNCYRDSCIHLVSEKELLKTTNPRCQKNPTKPNVIPDTSYLHWFPRSKCQSQEVKKDDNSTPEALSSLFCSLTVEDNPCADIVPLLDVKSTYSMDEATEKAKEIAVIFNLDKNSVEDPPDDIKRRCRKFCKERIERGQRIVVQALRDELPSGMTGPFQVKHDLLVKEMDLKIKETLSQALTVRKMEWKIFAKEKVNLSADKIDFYNDREKNPVLEILNEHCGDWSVDDLYTAIVDCGANAIADRYL